MAIEIPFEASLDIGNGAKSIKSLKQDYKDAQKELDGLTVGSEKYIDTLKRLGGIKDEIGDLNAEINAFNPEGKVQAFGSVIGGLASGFQAATGAAALFGSESEDVQKALLKVQAVMAFTEGIKGVMGMKDAFTVLGNVIKANPIMFIATIIIAATAAIYALTKSLVDNEEKQRLVNEQNQKFAELLEEEIKLIHKKNDIINKAYSNEITLLKARGATLEEINAKEDAFYNKRRAQLIYIQGYRGQLNAEESAELLALTNEKILRSEQYVAKVKADLESVTKKNKEELDKQNKDDFAAKQAAQDFIQSEKQKAFDAESAAFDKKKSDEQLAFEESQAIEAYKQGEKQRAFDDEVRKVDELAAKKKKASDDEMAAVNGTLSAAQASTDSLMALSDVYFAYKSKTLQKGSAAELKAAKDQFNINKALSIASATIMGIQATIAAYQSGAAVPVVGVALGPAMAILAGVTAAANIAKIASMQFNAGGGGSVPTLTATSGGAPPTINAPQNSTTKLNPDGTVVTPPTTKTPVVKAIVVESEMTTTQNRISTITEQATFG